MLRQAQHEDFIASLALSLSKGEARDFIRGKAGAMICIVIT
jgi:hypothetical protein